MSDFALSNASDLLVLSSALGYFSKWCVSHIVDLKNLRMSPIDYNFGGGHSSGGHGHG